MVDVGRLGDCRVRQLQLSLNLGCLARKKDVPGWTTLLSLQPASQAVEVEHMSADQLLGRLVRSSSICLVCPLPLPLLLPLILSLCLPRCLSLPWSCGSTLSSRPRRSPHDHLLPANDTHPISKPADILFCRIGILSVHIPRCAAIANKIRAAG